MDVTKVIDNAEYRNKVDVFEDRLHAGDLLADMLDEYRDDRDAFVLAIPAGGVPVASVVASELELPLDVVITRKLHVPWNKEAGFGALSWNGLERLNKPLVRRLGLTEEQIEEVIRRERKVINMRMRKFRGNKPFPNLKDKTAVLIDDGLASGYSMLTTAQALERHNPKKIIVAIPTAPLTAIERVKPTAEKIYCLNIRTGLVFAVASAYKHWRDLSDKEVLSFLEKHAN